MRLFMLMFLTVYGAMNAYFFWKFHRAYPRWNALAFGTLLFLLLMVFAPMITRYLDGPAHQLTAARVTALIGYTWMGLVLWFVVLAGAGDLWNGIVRLTTLAWPAARRAILAPRPAFLAYAGLILVASVWGVCEASAIRLKTITLRTASLPRGSAPIRAVQISDVHVGLIVREGRLGKILRLVHEARPDILFDTGDLLDASFRALSTEVEMLAAIRPPLGKFAVFGNHEYYAGAADSQAFIRACGFRLLRGESVTLDHGRLRVAGVDDPASRLGTAALARQEAAALANGAAPRPATILLKHQPRIDPASPGKFDLQLSGHTHDGQIFPFKYFVRLFYSRMVGLYHLDRDSTLYVSHGSGTWGPPMRLFARPEVTLIILEPEG